MAKIVIKDLSENLELDRKAMQAITGGSRWRSQAGAISTQPQRGGRIVDFRRVAPPKPATK